VSTEPDTAGPACATGRLYSWSTVHVSASRPVPYTLGYVDLEDGLRVLALLDGDTSELRMDGPVRLVTRHGELTFAPRGRP
jgi:uncharacterized protein